MIKDYLYFLGLVGTIVLLFKFCDFKKSDDATTIDGAGLIQQQILNVGKLIVTEGHFSEVITYKKSREILDGYYYFDKKH
jgi:hypothetical protein